MSAYYFYFVFITHAASYRTTYITSKRCPAQLLASSISTRCLLIRCIWIPNDGFKTFFVVPARFSFKLRWCCLCIPSFPNNSPYARRYYSSLLRSCLFESSKRACSPHAIRPSTFPPIRTLPSTYGHLIDTLSASSACCSELPNPAYSPTCKQNPQLLFSVVKFHSTCSCTLKHNFIFCTFDIGLA